MREPFFSTCEREFILRAIGTKLRLDGRQPYDYRRWKITFGVERGCCQVELGKTRVLAQVLATVTQPKANRPTDGVLFVNVELSPMASPSFEPGRFSEVAVYVNRLMERCLKESRCLDTESLCIVAGEKVWNIRVDVHVLNHDGNLIDCASVAAITALAHFRRPDVTVSAEEVTVHPVDEKEPIPLSLHHMPVCVSFAFFQQGKYLLVDPTEKEEKVMDGKMVIGMNKHREICTLQMAGDMLLMDDQIRIQFPVCLAFARTISKSQGQMLQKVGIWLQKEIFTHDQLYVACSRILRCSNIAVVKVKEISDLIQTALENDRIARSTGAKFGFAESVEPQKITAMQKELAEVDLSNLSSKEAELLTAPETPESSSESSSSSCEINSPCIKLWGAGTAQLGKDIESSSSESDDSEIMETAPPHPKVKTNQFSVQASEVIDIDDDSEDEVTIIQDTPDIAKAESSSAPEGKKPTLRDLLLALKKKKCN